MKDYELDICKALQHDIKELSGNEWELDLVYSFWLEWSETLAAGFLGYEQGDFTQLKWAIDVLYEDFFSKDKGSLDE